MASVSTCPSRVLTATAIAPRISSAIISMPMAFQRFGLNVVVISAVAQFGLKIKHTQYAVNKSGSPTEITVAPKFHSYKKLHHTPVANISTTAANPNVSTGWLYGVAAVGMVPCNSVNIKINPSHNATIIRTQATPKNFPTTNNGRGTGLLTTVSTVLFSISLLTTPVARNADRITPHMKRVDSPISMNIR